MAYTSKRCCGDSRTAGDLYLEVATSPYGKPLEEFLWCPPQPVDIEQLGGSKVGIHYMPPREVAGKEVFDVFDWIGEDSYPNVHDFIGEAQALGFSRKISSAFDFSKLSQQSWIFFIHPRGYIDNFQIYVKTEPDAPTIVRCPATKHRLGDKKEMCARHWSTDLTPGPGSDRGFMTFAEAQGLSAPEMLGVLKDLEHLPSYQLARFRQVTLPCGFSYAGFQQPHLAKPPQPPCYQPAIIGAFPLGRIVAIESDDGRHETKAEKARKGRLPVTVESA